MKSVIISVVHLYLYNLKLIVKSNNQYFIYLVNTQNVYNILLEDDSEISGSKDIMTSL